MPPAGPQYTLVGFSPELDWRPLTFLKPIPANRVCSACGLVRKTSALLPCMHVLCEPCHQQCVQDGSQVCPLDGNGYGMEDVHMMECPADELLRREVKCWNEGSGCQYATAASRISQHFLLECEHHSVRCTRCSATVLCRDVCTHLRSASCNTSTPVTSESQVPVSHLDEAASLTSFRGAIERKGDEITAYLRPMAVDIGTHGDRLSEISHGINSIKEALRLDLMILIGQNHEEIMSSNADLRQCLVSCLNTVKTSLRSINSVEKTFKDKFGRTRADLSKIAASIDQVKAELKGSVQKSLQYVPNVPGIRALQVTHCEFLVNGVKSLQEEAMKIGAAKYESEKVYLCGYRMSPGVRFARGFMPIVLQLMYTLHKCDMDDYVQWPFQHKIRISVIHPSGSADHVLEVKPNPYHPDNQKPATSNSPLIYFGDCLHLENLIRDGYIYNDQLQIKWELLP
ncbi:TNF receptor-associated factor 6-like isoform X4 [Amblyomma americanum]